jgi:HEAT repeat protein
VSGAPIAVARYGACRGTSLQPPIKRGMQLATRNDAAADRRLPHDMQQRSDNRMTIDLTMNAAHAAAARGNVALEHAGSLAELEALLDALYHPDPPLRCAALARLAERGDPAAVAAVGLATDDDDATVRQSARAALCAFRDPAALAALLMLAAHPRSCVRAAALRALRPHAEPEVRRALLRASSDASREVRDEARQGLRELDAARLLAPPPSAAAVDFGFEREPVDTRDPAWDER